MKNIIFKTEKILVYCLLFASSFLVAQTTYTVNNIPNTAANFTNLQTAINTVAAGSILYIQQSPTSYGNITINKKITLIGRSHSDASYKSQVGTVSFATGASDSIIKGLLIAGIGESGNATLSNITILDNVISSISIGNQHTFNNTLIQGNVLKGSIYLYTQASNTLITNNLIFSSTLYFANVDTLLISNNIFSYYAGPSFTNASASDVLNISNCIFITNYQTITKVTLNPGSAAIQVNNCLTYNYNTTYTYGFTTGVGITISGNVKLNTNPLFTNVGLTAPGLAHPSNSSDLFNPATDNLTLQAGSPVTDGGIFKDYKFKLYGTPTGYPTIKVVENSATVPKNGNLSVTIEAKTN